MNILLINRQAKPEVSGIASHFENIAQSLLSQGHHVERLVAKDPDFFPKSKNIKYHTFLYLKKKSTLKKSEKNTRLKKNRDYFIDALKKIDWKKIDSVITSNDIYLPMIKKMIAPRKVIAIIPSSLAFSKKSNPLNYLAVIERAKKNLIGVKTVVLSSSMKKMLVDALGEKYDISVVYPGVDKERFSKNSSKKTDILYVGRIDKEKNTEEMMHAINKVKMPLSLTIVGSGNETEKIKELSKKFSPDKKVFFAGMKKRVEKYYAQSRIFVLPSKFEAFGLVILEAMSSGLPVIAFKPGRKYITASDEIIDDGTDGFLVKTVGEMAQKIELLLKDKKLLYKMGKNATKKADKFNWNNHVTNLLRLIS